MMMKTNDWENSEVTLSMRNQIDAYVQETLSKEIPRSTFLGYRAYLEQGTRKESEQAYFVRRKQLAAFGLYLQYHRKSESSYEVVLDYFQELLWTVAGEFTWCVMAHLPLKGDGFAEQPATQIDLFAAETAEAFAELITIHSDILHPFLINYIRQQIMERVFLPFLSRDWWWETVQSNWSAVCCGSIGMAAMLLEQGEIRESLLKKVDRGMTYYLNSFGEDGACEEGIGYWVYGFGYYTYYIAMRKESDPTFVFSEAIEQKIKRIADFPRLVQMQENQYLPFSDVPARTLIPTGLLSYLAEEYQTKLPVSTRITPFDFDHCYRFAHISRNLWWTKKNLCESKLINEAVYLPDRQWLLQRWDGIFMAAKGGSNQEQHNHNDVGSLVLAIDGELFLADLGAGVYTADYFGEQRYEYIQTRSRYHNVPLIHGQEQMATGEICRVEQVETVGETAGMTMELSPFYPSLELIGLRRTIHSDRAKECVLLQDHGTAKEDISFEEGFVSHLRPTCVEAGSVILTGEKGQLIISYDDSLLTYSLEELWIENHYKEQQPAYRLSFALKEKSREFTVELSFHYRIGITGEHRKGDQLWM